MEDIWHYNRTNEFYQRFLTNLKFNEEQIEFLSEQVKDFSIMKQYEYFDYDCYERDMWYTMNRSGLFEKDIDNKTGITNWSPNHTRKYITEIDKRMICTTKLH